MVTRGEITRGIYGAWRLALRDPRAMALFDRTVPGTIRSFWAAAVCYPGFLALLLLRIDPAQFHAPLIYRILLVQTIGYVVGWAAYPLAALPFCRWLATEERALGFIIAYNWAQVVQTALLLPFATFAAVRPTAGAYSDLAAYLAILVYEWFIARIALDKGPLPATALVLLDVVLGASLSQITMAIAHQAL
jgi:hypothetical protein